MSQAGYTPEPGDPIKQAPVEPLRRGTAEPDDPTEPFSRNYGTVRPGAPRPAPARVSSLERPAGGN
jgi:hypothetical protein